jgi:phage tail sheath protein|nr:MAG TPA: tail sheath protein [Caudoviricetes sp.]
MALGGGTFTTQNKILPGAYINFISLVRARANLGDRGTATMPLELDWGKDDEVFEVTNADFQKNSLKIFGYDYAHEKLKGLRDLFLNLNTLYAYKLNKGTKAANTYTTAKYSGIRGNDLKVIIQQNVDQTSKWDVTLMIDTVVLDTQTVANAQELKDNDFVDWKKSATLQATSGEKLTGGTNGTVNVSNHQTYLDKIESYSFNVLGVITTADQVKSLYIAFTKRMRDEVGAKFQLVVHDKKADYEGVINIKNDVNLVYWVTGLEAACAINKSCLNRKYDGEFDVNVNYTQAQLKQAIKDGEFTLHKVGKEIRVLEDINSLVTVTDEKGEVFQDNQTIRVIDQIANDIAILFNTKYLGIVQNDESGRISLWADIVKHHEELQKLRAIENFTDKDVEIAQGDGKKAVLIIDKVTVVNTMAQLYMVVKIA